MTEEEKRQKRNEASRRWYAKHKAKKAVCEARAKKQAQPAEPPRPREELPEPPAEIPIDPSELERAAEYGSEQMPDEIGRGLADSDLDDDEDSDDEDDKETDDEEDEDAFEAGSERDYIRGRSEIWGEMSEQGLDEDEF